MRLTRGGFKCGVAAIIATIGMGYDGWRAWVALSLAVSWLLGSIIDSMTALGWKDVE